MGDIESIMSVGQGGPTPFVGLSAREPGSVRADGVGQSAATVPPARSGASVARTFASEPRSAATVRSGHFAGDGRFEKFILALQALRLDYDMGASRTDRTDRMRAAAEELFGIDGVPQPVRPAAGPAAVLVHAAAQGQAAPASAAAAEAVDPVPQPSGDVTAADTSAVVDPGAGDRLSPPAGARRG